MPTDRFRSLLDRRGPFATAYFDDSHDTADADAQLDVRWRDLTAQLHAQGAPGDVTDAMRAAIDARRPAVGRSGRCLIATSDGVVLDERVDRVPENSVTRYSELPYLVPLIEHGGRTPSHVIVTVDHEGADVEVRTAAGTRTHTVDGGGHPVHKASGAETAGYGDPQQRTDEAARKNVRAVVDDVTALVDELSPAAVFVNGEVRSRKDFTSAAPQRVADLVVEVNAGARHSVDEAALDADVTAWLRDAARAEVRRAAEQLAAELGRASGLATEGLHGVCAALREGAVETLIVGDTGGATVVFGDAVTTVAPDPSVLSELGVSPDHIGPADEVLPLAAVATDAVIVGADDELAPRDGVAAVLRYAPATLQR
ncbi:Rv2629 family ribosome hibernation factor [Mycolicibacterium grossiae]|uniref:Peptide chain release factor 2 n=1 Tax=Mycolicibacterium grossiae TaxID=1552759 RepID=A0A1E8QBA8_9MYCO|nr:hypothetical protein [Mycolicibacterium grossiae]OFJ55726.1 hypothetical protein BEL07_00525 [Mycolicibacterium grossiae]QEM43436.1 hypothetical protein FZ046_00375 [Mycolicibacterium grossiae]